MKTKNTLLVSAVVALAISLGIGFSLNFKPNGALGGLVEQQDKVFVNGFRVGSNESRVMDGSGNLTVPGTVTVGSTEVIDANGSWVGDVKVTSTAYSMTLTPQTTIDDDFIVIDADKFKVSSNSLSIYTIGDLSVEDVTASGSLTITGTTTLTGLLSVVNASISNNLDIIGDLAVEDVAASGSLTITGTTGLTGLLSLVNASISGDLELTTNGGDITALGDLVIEDITASGSLDVSTLVQGGAVTAIASGSTHFTAAQVCDSSIITRNVKTASSSTDTLPTAATLIADCLPTNGDHKVVMWDNISDDAGEQVTLTANTGIDLLQASGSNQVLEQNMRALVEFWNLNGSSVSVTVIELGDAD